MHRVKCAVCGKEFDRDKIQSVKYSARRYAHLACYPEGEPVPLPESNKDKDLAELEKYILQLFQLDYLDARVKRQIKNCQKDYGLSYAEILSTLVYWFDIRGNSIEKANGGIGIVPFVYKDAAAYYDKIEKAQSANQGINLQDFVQKVKEIIISSPRTTIKKKKLFNQTEEEEDN